jgi:hypothetical protein
VQADVRERELEWTQKVWKITKITKTHPIMMIEKIHVSKLEAQWQTGPAQSLIPCQWTAEVWPRNDAKSIPLRLHLSDAKSNSCMTWKFESGEFYSQALGVVDFASGE